MEGRQQTDKLWNWCGLTYHWYPAVYGGTSPSCGWYSIDGKFRCSNKPNITLDTLYRYAIPKLQKEGYWIQFLAFENNGFRITISGSTKSGFFPIIVESDSPTKALYQAIMKVIDSEVKHD